MSDADLSGPMPAPRRIGSRGTLLSGRATLIAAVCTVLVAVALANWIVQIPGNAAHTDFAASYASAALFREGHAAIMFDPVAQSDVLHAAGGGASSTTSPAALTPAAILVLVPFTALPLWLASLLWSLLQVVLLGLAALVATRAAPWPAQTFRSTRAIVAVAAMCGGGTLMLLPLNQWDGIAAAALALTYADLRRGHDHRAMLWLTVGLLVGKPHLGIGLALFLVARRPLSIVSGAIAAAVVGGMTILLVPLAAIGQWVGTIVHVSGLYPASSTIGMSGLVGSFLGAWRNVQRARIRARRYRFARLRRPGATGPEPVARTRDWDGSPLSWGDAAQSVDRTARVPLRPGPADPGIHRMRRLGDGQRRGRIVARHACPVSARRMGHGRAHLFCDDLAAGKLPTDRLAPHVPVGLRARLHCRGAAAPGSVSSG